MKVSGRRTWLELGAVTLLTAYVLAVHGYHPYSEDGGLYVAGVKKLLAPGLYPEWTVFVTEHLRFSVFAPLVAGLVRASGLGLEWVLFGIYLVSVWATLLAGWMLAGRVVAGWEARVGAVTLLAGALAMPIAGTSLLLFDPYVTARNFSTPLVLFALAWALGRRGDVAAALTPPFAQDAKDGAPKAWRWVWCGVALAAAAVVHPLMAGYGVAAVAVLMVVQAAEARRWIGLGVLLACALAVAIVVQARAPAESADYVSVAMTRYYWFPFRWEWYEQVGLVAPLVVIWMLGRWALSTRGSQTLVRMALALGGIALVVAVAFCRARMAVHAVARLQPLRCFQLVYVVLLVLLGAWLGERVLRRVAWRWGLLVAGLGGLMFFVAGQTYPASAHVEWPGRAERNGWVQAFVWARENTPQDALFALDSHYITRDGEDAQSFRALAERSAVADYSKDGGEASITPELTADWVRGQAATAGLDRESDGERLGKLGGLGVGWVVLETASETGWSCLYRNAVVKVCRVPPPEK